MSFCFLVFFFFVGPWYCTQFWFDTLRELLLVPPAYSAPSSISHFFGRLFAPVELTAYSRFVSDWPRASVRVALIGLRGTVRVRGGCISRVHTACQTIFSNRVVSSPHLFGPFFDFGLTFGRPVGRSVVSAYDAKRKRKYHPLDDFPR